MLSRKLAPLLLLGLIALAAPRARAVINIDMPVEKIFEAVKAVAIGTVTAVNGENRVIDLKTTAMLKGAPVGDVFRVQISAPAELIKKISADQPLVLMTGEDFGKPVALIHVADTWLLAEFLPASKTPAWRVVQAHQAKRSFSGSTAELVKLLSGLKGAK